MQNNNNYYRLFLFLFFFSLTFHYWLYPVWLCMWQIIKNLENLIYIIITTVNSLICPSVLIMMRMSRGMKWMLTDSDAAQRDQMVTLGELWRQHRAEAPEVTAQWRANWFSYRINRSARQSQAKLMTRVFSSALLGMLELLLNNREKFPKTATTFMKKSAEVSFSP